MTTESRKPRDVRGQALPLRFKIVDRRPGGVGAAEAHAAGDSSDSSGGAAVGGKEADEGAAGGKAGGKSRAPPGRGPYKVSIMLTGGCTRTATCVGSSWLLVPVPSVPARPPVRLLRGPATHLHVCPAKCSDLPPSLPLQAWALGR